LLFACVGVVREDSAGQEARQGSGRRRGRRRQGKEGRQETGEEEIKHTQKLPLEELRKMETFTGAAHAQ